MRRILLLLVGLVVVSALARLEAQTNTASLTVSASVTKNCTISTTPVNFGAYDPVAANATAPLDGLGSIVVTCTKGAAAKVGLNPGGSPDGTARRMIAAAAEYLAYELYKDTTHSTVWGDGLDTALDIPAAPNRNPRTFSVYGRINAGQDATVGNYTDTVVATVNF
jgi:spore coat protein U-like protein